MPADSSDVSSVEQQALHALNYLSDEDKHKVLEYIESLLILEKAKHDKTSVT